MDKVYVVMGDNGEEYGDYREVVAGVYDDIVLANLHGNMLNTYVIPQEFTLNEGEEYIRQGLRPIGVSYRRYLYRKKPHTKTQWEFYAYSYSDIGKVTVLYSSEQEYTFEAVIPAKDYKHAEKKAKIVFEWLEKNKDVWYGVGVRKENLNRGLNNSCSLVYPQDIFEKENENEE